jgi:hypothetical protein
MKPITKTTPCGSCENKAVFIDDRNNFLCSFHYMTKYYPDMLAEFFPKGNSPIKTKTTKPIKSIPKRKFDDLVFN